jgi:hypothetical protein
MPFFGFGRAASVRSPALICRFSTTRMPSEAGFSTSELTAFWALISFGTTGRANAG